MQMSLRSSIHGLGATKAHNVDKGPVPAVFASANLGLPEVARSRNCSVKEFSHSKSLEKDMLQYLCLQDTPPDLKQHNFFSLIQSRIFDNCFVFYEKLNKLQPSTSSKVEVIIPRCRECWAVNLKEQT